MKRRRIWRSSPLLYLLPVVIAVMSFINFENKLIFFSELAVALLSALLILLLSLQFRTHVRTVLRGASDILTGHDLDALESFALPVVIAGDAGDIVWFNSAFWGTVANKSECRGEDLTRYIMPYTIRQMITGSGVPVVLGEKEFTVYGCKMTGGTLLYYVDDTYYKKVSREFVERAPCVALVSFDNREELARGATTLEDAKIVSEVEAQLLLWAKDMGGFLRRLNDSRYLLMTDEGHVASEVEKRFEILDRIRAIKNAQNFCATISVGIGRAAQSFEESERRAGQALDMALGRGGDQVAIKQKGDSYEFFGGVSKGVEKRDKVRTRVIAATLSDHISGCDNVFIMGHRSADLDCIGAAVGLWSAVTNVLKKNAYIVVNRNTCLAREMLDSVEADEKDHSVFLQPQDAFSMVTQQSMVIVVDTHCAAFTESQDILDRAGMIVVIDHHRMMVNYIKNAVVFYHEPYASSASEMVSELVQYIGSSVLTRVQAEALLAGIMLDTKGFIIKTGARTFEVAAYLKRRGADTVEVKKMFSNSFDVYKTKAKIISSAEIKNGCAIACCDDLKPSNDTRIIAAQAADELLSIQGVDASFVICAETGDSINISARSMGDINVQLVMEKLGGGGHHSMAGAQLNNMTAAQAKEILILAVNEQQKQKG